MRSTTSLLILASSLLIGAVSCSSGGSSGGGGTSANVVLRDSPAFQVRDQTGDVVFTMKRLNITFTDVQIVDTTGNSFPLTLASNPLQVDVLALATSNTPFASGGFPPGTYSRFELTVTNAEVVGTFAGSNTEVTMGVDLLAGVYSAEFDPPAQINPGSTRFVIDWVPAVTATTGAAGTTFQLQDQVFAFVSLDQVSFFIEGGFAGPQLLAVADFLEDGRDEVVDDSNGSVTTFAVGTLGDFQLDNIGGSVFDNIGSMATRAGDLDGDGKPDLLRSVQGTLTYFPNINPAVAQDGNPFDFFASIDIGSVSARSLFVIEINGDGQLDIVAGLGGNQVAILLNQGFPSFSAPTVFQTAPDPGASGRGAQSLVIDDFDGDGRLDIAATNAVSNGLPLGSPIASTVTVLLNTTPAAGATPSFSSTQVGPGDSAVDVGSGDINGDTISDLVVLTAGGVTYVQLSATAPGAPSAQFTTADPPIQIPGSSSVLVADIDRDASVDLLFTSSAAEESNMIVFLNRSHRLSPSPRFLEVIPTINRPSGVPEELMGYTSIRTMNIDSDGTIDLLINGPVGFLALRNQTIP